MLKRHINLGYYLMLGIGIIGCKLNDSNQSQVKTEAFNLSPSLNQGQASLNLTGSNATTCYQNDTSWTLEKEVSSITDDMNGGKVVTWNVLATRGSTSNNILTVDGFVSIQNAGSAPATIGNILVNLQRSLPIPNKGSKWVSASVDIADASNGDAATKANIVAAASQEDPSWNSLYNTPTTYSITSGKGVFKENTASGSLLFTDQNNNSVWAISPIQTIPAGGTINLLFRASFNNTILQIPVGESLRAEVIVSFGNAGPRGGSGASLSNIDISGNGSLEPDETYVRSVPTRITVTVPALKQGNNEVLLTDTGITDSGTVSVGNTNYQGYDVGNTISQTTVFQVITSGVLGGQDGGLICNAATLKGQSCDVQVIVGYNTITNPDLTTTQVPIYYNFPCVVGVDLNASACVEIPGEENPPPPPPPFHPGEYCTYSQGGFGNNGSPYQLLANQFNTVYPSGIEIGIPGASGYSMKFNTASNVQAYLPATSTPGVLTADLINPTSSSSGVFGGQVLTLKINTGLSQASVTPNGFGNLYYCNAGNSLHGKTVSQILGILEIALGGGPLPAGYTYSSLNNLADQLNTQVFHECQMGSFIPFMSKTPCP